MPGQITVMKQTQILLFVVAGYLISGSMVLAGCGLMDLALLLDESGFVGKENWTLVINFTKELVGLQYGGGNTNTAAGLRTVHENLYQIGDRNDFRNIVLVFIDGKSDSKERTKEEAAFLQEKSSCVICVAVGSNVNREETMAIASDPDHENLIALSTFSDLLPSFNKVKTAVCKCTVFCKEPSVQNGYTQGSERHVGAKVNITCKAGHMFPDRQTVKTILCTVDLDWIPRIEQCTAISTSKAPGHSASTQGSSDMTTHHIDTSAQPISTKASSGVTTHQVETTSNPSGDPGSIQRSSDMTTHQVDTTSEALEHPESKQTRSGMTGPVDVTPLTAGHNSAGRCTKPPVFQNAATLGCSRHIGAEVRIKCKQGHVFPDGMKEKIVRCTSREVWEPETEQCIDETNSSSVVCEKGYELRTDKSDVPRCSTNKNIGGVPNCKPRACEPLPEKEHAIPGTYGLLYYHDQVPYVCEDGYETKDKKSIFWTTCNEFGEWVFDSASACLRIVCPPIPTWAGLTVNTTDTSYRTTVNYTCEEGYYFADRWRYRYTTCRHDRRWQPEVVGCLGKKKAYEPESPAEAPFAPVLGAVVIGILGVVGCFICALDCVFLLKGKDKNNKDNSET